MAAHEMSFGPEGRWAGRLTRRPLPVDPSIDRLSGEERSLLAGVWLGRAASERRVADAFVVIEGALVALGTTTDLTRLAARAVDDELRHAEISRVVASRYAGRELDAPPRIVLTVPAHPRASERLRHVLHVVGQCCVNETIASAFLEATLAQVEAPLAAAALRELLADEIDHGRIGWAVLASVDAVTRAAVAGRAPAMAVATLRMWRASPRSYFEREPFPQHGAPPEAVVEAAFSAAFRDLVVPGFEALGLDVERLRVWAERGMPT